MTNTTTPRRQVPLRPNSNYICNNRPYNYTFAVTKKEKYKIVNQRFHQKSLFVLIYIPLYVLHLIYDTTPKKKKFFFVLAVNFSTERVKKDNMR